MTDGFKDYANLVAQVGPGVVRVDGRRGYPLSGVVHSDGHVVTTSRAAEREEDIRVMLANGETVAAELLGRDPRTDLALLKVTGDLPPVIWAEAEGLRVGQVTLRLGRTGDGLRATLGVLSGLGGPWHSAWGGRLEHSLLSDAATFPGFSGGPLITTAGEVVGLGTAALNRAGNALVPAATVRRVVGALLAHGHVRRGYLGLSSQPVRLPVETREALGQRSGLLLVAVEADSPAAQAGLVLGDTLLAFQGEPLRHPGQLLAQLSDELIGQAVSLSVLRGGQVQSVTVTVGERPRSG